MPAAFLAMINLSVNENNLRGPMTGVKVVEGPFPCAAVSKRAGRIDLYARQMYVREFLRWSFGGEFFYPAGSMRGGTGNETGDQREAVDWISWDGGGGRGRWRRGWIFTPGRAGRGEGGKRSGGRG